MNGFARQILTLDGKRELDSASQKHPLSPAPA